MLGAVAQATAVLLLLPVLVSLRGLSLQELPQYVSDGMLGQLPDTALQRLTNPSHYVHDARWPSRLPIQPCLER